MAKLGFFLRSRKPPRFIELGAINEIRTAPAIAFRTNQGVSKQRQQAKVFKLTGLQDKTTLKIVIQAAYRQIFERNIAPYVIQNEFTVWETKLSNGDINLKEFIAALGTSSLYIKEFYIPYPNTKVIELGTKHFLGRAPLDQAEIRKYNQILATQGLKSFIETMTNSMEYAQLFGEDTVPYRRFPTLPAANFPNTEKLYNRLTKQNDTLVVPSFSPVKSQMEVTAMPLMVTAMNDLQIKARQMDLNKPLLIAQGRSFTQGSGQAAEAGVAPSHQPPARIYRLNPGASVAEAELVINALYCQVMDTFSDQVPEQFRHSELENKLKQGEITVREFVKTLASSEVYRERFYTPYPPTKVIEFLFRHLLGRTSATQEEILHYHQILADQGLEAAVKVMVDSPEYARYYGEDVVPYKRFPTLPAGNYLGSVKAAAELGE